MADAEPKRKPLSPPRKKIQGRQREENRLKKLLTCIEAGETVNTPLMLEVIRKLAEDQLKILRMTRRERTKLTTMVKKNTRLEPEHRQFLLWKLAEYDLLDAQGRLGVQSLLQATFVARPKSVEVDRPKAARQTARISNRTVQRPARFSGATGA